MADHIIPANAENMIEALKNYIRQVSDTIEKLYGVSAQCKQVLGNEDIIAKNLDPNIIKIANHYHQVTQKALGIIADINIDLQERYKDVERTVTSDESYDD